MKYGEALHERSVPQWALREFWLFNGTKLRRLNGTGTLTWTLPLNR